MAFTIQASNKDGLQTFPAASAREAIDMIADLLSSNFRIEHLADDTGARVDYDEIVRVRFSHWAG